MSVACRLDASTSAVTTRPVSTSARATPTTARPLPTRFVVARGPRTPYGTATWSSTAACTARLDAPGVATTLTSLVTTDASTGAHQEGQHGQEAAPVGARRRF